MLRRTLLHNCLFRTNMPVVESAAVTTRRKRSYFSEYLTKLYKSDSHNYTTWIHHTGGRACHITPKLCIHALRVDPRQPPSRFQKALVTACSDRSLTRVFLCKRCSFGISPRAICKGIRGRNGGQNEAFQPQNHVTEHAAHLWHLKQEIAVNYTMVKEDSWNVSWKRLCLRLKIALVKNKDRCESCKNGVAVTAPELIER